MEKLQVEKFQKINNLCNTFIEYPRVHNYVPSWSVNDLSIANRCKLNRSLRKKHGCKI